MTEIPHNPENENDNERPANPQELEDLRKAIVTKIVPELYPGDDIDAQEDLGWKSTYVTEGEDGPVIVFLDMPVPGREDEFPMPTELNLDKRLKTLDNGHEIWETTTYEIPDQITDFGSLGRYYRKINEVDVKKVNGKVERIPVRSDQSVNIASALKAGADSGDWTQFNDVSRQIQADSEMDKQLGNSGAITNKQCLDLILLLAGLQESDRRMLEE